MADRASDKGTSVKWPVGLGGKGNEGVAGVVRQMQGAIGYVELIYAVQNNIPYGARAELLRSFREGVARQRDCGRRVREEHAGGLPRIHHQRRLAKDAYPISSFTWLLIPAQSKDAAKGKILQDFLSWMLSDGQKMTAALTYAPLPDSVVDKVKAGQASSLKRTVEPV